VCAQSCKTNRVEADRSSHPSLQSHLRHISILSRGARARFPIDLRSHIAIIENGETSRSQRRIELGSALWVVLDRCNAHAPRQPSFKSHQKSWNEYGRRSASFCTKINNNYAVVSCARLMTEGESATYL